MAYQKNIINRIFTALFITGIALFAYIAFLPIVSAAAVDDSVWITSTRPDIVSRISKTTNTVIATIGVGSGANGAAVDQDSVWVANYTSNTVSRINKATNTVIATFGAGSHPYNIAVDQDSVWVTNNHGYGAGTVTRINKTTYAIIATIGVGAGPYGIAVDRDFVWATNYYSSSVSKISKTTNTVIATFGAGSMPRGVAVDQDSIWVANLASNTVSRINKASNAVIATIAVGTYPAGIAVDSDSVWVANYISRTVSRISKTTNTVIETIGGLGETSHGIAIDQDSAWVVNSGPNTVSRINKASNAVVATIAVGGAVYGFGDTTGWAYDMFFTSAAVCGNGIIETGEECDDGNLINGDGCSSTCTIKATCPSGMVSYWKFDETSGSTVADSVDGNPGTLVNGPVWTTGKVGGALNFDGVNDYINTTLNPITLGQNITISAWVYPRSEGNYNGIGGGHGIPTYSGITFMQYFNNGWECGYGSGTTWAPGNKVSLTLNAWNYVTCVWAGGKWTKVYVNGVLPSPSNNMPQGLNIAQVNYFWIGKAYDSPGRYFNGLIDEFAIYNRALSAEEIQQQYQNGLNGNGYCEAPPVAICGNGIIETGEQCDEGAEDLGNNKCIDNQIGKKCDPATCQIQDVISVAETCNNKDDDCEGAIDEGVTKICGDSWTGICTMGFETCSEGAWAGCNAQFPKQEDCNNLDDDCDGFVDEILASRSCGTDAGECNSGYQLCAYGAWSQCNNTGPTPELCDNKDNNCDGITDDFFGPYDCPIGQGARCAYGAWGNCQSVTVTDSCDGLDNDNDGQIDEDFASAICSTSGIGECSAGVTVCEGASGATCTGQGPASEICDGKDNDCDNQIDESLQRACTTSGMAGAQRCINTDWGPCDPINKTAEICDNLDNDWNGLVDDSLTASCYLGPSGTEGVGVCKSGLRSCASGVWSGCLGQVLPSAEICDGKDNDCDGIIDENLTRFANELGECSINTETCSAGSWIANNEYTPAADNNCDGLDQNCDGVNDNSYAPTQTNCGIGECAKTGQLICSNGATQDTCAPGLPTFEIPGNNLDENCDSIITCDSSALWKNHGDFVSCVTKEAQALYKAELITEGQRSAIVNSAAKSDVGKK